MGFVIFVQIYFRLEQKKFAKGPPDGHVLKNLQQSLEIRGLSLENMEGRVKELLSSKYFAKKKEELYHNGFKCFEGICRDVVGNGASVIDIY